MKIQDAIQQFYDELANGIDSQVKRNADSLEQKKRVVDQRRRELEAHHKAFREKLEEDLAKGWGNEEYKNGQIKIMDSEVQSFEAKATETLRRQTLRGDEMLEKLRTTLKRSLADKIFVKLYAECVGNANLIKKGFAGIPTHVQRFEKKWRLIAEAIGADPDRFAQEIKKEKTGVMYEPWRRFAEMKRLRRHVRGLARTGDKEAQKVIEEIENGYARL